MVLKIKKLDKSLPLPNYMSNGSAGIDLYACTDREIVLKPMDRCLISTGIILEIPNGYEGQVRPRSGLAIKHGITVLNTPGTIDSDYRGEIKVILINLGKEDFIVKRGMRIAQLVISPICKVSIQEVDKLEETTRGENGFGSTGL